eukprot:358066-Chlamydomonas_euryale.AAC.4
MRTPWPSERVACVPVAAQPWILESELWCAHCQRSQANVDFWLAHDRPVWSLHDSVAAFLPAARLRLRGVLGAPVGGVLPGRSKPRHAVLGDGLRRRRGV